MRQFIDREPVSSTSTSEKNSDIREPPAVEAHPCEKMPVNICKGYENFYYKISKWPTKDAE